MNREMIARTRDRIAEVGADHCDMDSYVVGTMVGAGLPECGTTACIAGHAIAVARGMFSDAVRADWEGWLGMGAAVLGLTHYEAVALFQHDYWPDHYRTIARAESHAKAMVQILDDLLDGTVAFVENWDLRSPAMVATT